MPLNAKIKLTFFNPNCAHIPVPAVPNVNNVVPIFLIHFGVGFLISFMPNLTFFF